MTTKRKHIKQSKFNYFDLGGIVGALGGASGLVGLGINNLNVPTAQNSKITALTNELLMSLMLNYKPIEFLKANVGGLALSGVASGASAGMALGPWGALAGGLIGGLSGGITSMIGNDKKQQLEQLLKAQQMRAFSTQANTIGLNSFNTNLANSLAEGGSIHINPANRGKFNATKARTGKTTEELTHSSNPLTRKRAIFALNAAKWNHALGGELFDLGGNLYAELPNLATHGGEFGNGGIEINAGGIHELNPMGGVPMGMGLNGKPNLVEEGEYKFKDYIFSNRLKYDGKTSFADMAKKEAKESSERPNDPISKNGLNVGMGKLLKALEMLKLAQGVKEGNSFWPGGKLGRGLLNNNLMNLQINNPGTTLDFVDKNQFQNKPMGFDPNNVMNSNTYAFANKGDLPLINQIGQLGSSKGLNGLGQDNLLRYAPIAASGLASLTDALGVTNTPDYDAVKDLLGLDTLGVKGQRLSDYVNYKPLDTNYLTNQLGANAAGTRSGMRNVSGGNRATYMAGLLGADANYNQGLGQLGRQAAEYNQALKMLAAEFNRATNQFNAQLGNWEQGINTQLKEGAIKTKAQLKAAARQEARGAKMNNLNTFIEGLGDLGRETGDRRIIKDLYERLGIPVPKAYGGKLNTRK